MRLEVDLDSPAAPGAREETIEQRLQKFDRLTRWIDENVPKDLPSLSDEALRREWM
ncbi:hypothetical protein OP10G_2643 [Fimbriimonas ginsengisoli Gsoil 348]|uniref:Uncharacterized protein n=1 Tax=Fimbriimonas ginsengisoli Gsoil 348 TaxID=661478 RepID=A0A068NRF2_FIMGI|nr:hypothetical protein OP10G_2643 [Fimbriimonas ginsengisoli Gsoil 348]